MAHTKYWVSSLLELYELRIDFYFIQMIKKNNKKNQPKNNNTATIFQATQRNEK